MEEITQEKNTISVNIEDEMRGAYLDYAMSVIIGRALPDVRDGLKPVHRRVLYAMYDLGNTHNKPYKKSARVVGDVIGKYHPHGDVAVYDTIVRMAQDFSMRYILVDGQGNFGSIDGDAPAAMRYTEVRMSKITDEILADLEKETVDFVPNYDESLQEPVVFPTKIPNLLVNGSSGIAVGMATNIPPHNLVEIINAAVALIKNPALDTDALLEFVKGPDFPTAGYILGGSGIKQAYRTGKGVITIRGKAEIEPWKSDRERIIVTELPYQVNKAKLIEKIADLVRNKQIESISDLRDESDRTGMRIVIDVKKGENSNIALNQLYKMTALQESYGISLLAIHNNQPKIFSLRDMVWAFVSHRKDVVTRRTVFELKKSQARAHILEGLKKAVENIDAVIALIKKSRSPNEAKIGLMDEYELSEKQSQAILEMRLQKITGLEREGIIKEYNEVIALIGELRKILADETIVYGIIEKELLEIKATYGDERKTKITYDEAGDFNIEDLIADEETLVTITHRGYIKRSDPNLFRSQRRGGRGIRGMGMGDGDFVNAIYRTTNLSYLLCFSDKGKLYWLNVYKVPEAARTAKGKAVVNLITLSPNERIMAILPVREFKENEYVVMVTRNGTIKKTALSEFNNVRNAGIIAISIKKEDQLVGAKLTNGSSDIFLCSKYGKSIRFSEENVRSMGRSAQGVIGMDLENSDEVVALEVLDSKIENSEILAVTENGYGKRTAASEYRLQSRGGKGIITIKIPERNGNVVVARQVISKDDVMLVSNQGQMIRIRVGEISEQGRNTQGVRLMTMSSESEKVVALEYMAESDEEGNSGSSN